MLRSRFFRKIVFGPFRKVAGALVNIVVFDLAMTFYASLKRKFSQSKSEKDEDIVFIRPKFKSKGGG